MSKRPEGVATIVGDITGSEYANMKLLPKIRATKGHQANSDSKEIENEH